MITGYLVLRKPEYEYIVYEKMKLEPVDGVYYCGLVRSVWTDIDIFFLENRDTDLYYRYTSIKKSENDGTFISVVREESFANELLNLTYEIYLKNEIIVVESELLNSIKGGIIESNVIDWLGYDIAVLGAWSLIRHCIFENRIYDMLSIAPLNKYGLIDNKVYFNSFMKFYKKLSNQNKVEKIEKQLDKVILLRIGRLKYS